MNNFGGGPNGASPGGMGSGSFGSSTSQVAKEVANILALNTCDKALGKVGEIPPFFGGGQGSIPDFDDWLGFFNRVAQAKKWSDDDKRLQLPLAMRGTANLIYKGLDQDQKITFQDLVTNLGKFLRPTKKDENALNELTWRFQISNEPVVAFGYAIKELVTQMLVTNGAEVVDRTAEIDNRTNIFFLRGLQPQLKKFMRPAYDSFNDALEAARHLEGSNVGPTASMQHTANSASFLSAPSASSMMANAFAGILPYAGSAPSNWRKLQRS